MKEQDQEVLFSEEVLDILAPVWAEDRVAIEILLKLYLVHDGKEQGPITVARLANEITGTRREAIKDKKGRIIRYEMRKGLPIGRSRAEKVVDKLFHATLIDITDMPPSKILTISPRGEQLLVAFQKMNSEEEQQ